eukprot:GFKZ01015229.1.p1 GENE.GFKZ01015229.1~~GFKZ01015229.1.p1  ORF type:complete len:155 (-),score=30.39 GFKZ01015229.1:336-800(-)
MTRRSMPQKSAPQPTPPQLLTMSSSSNASSQMSSVWATLNAMKSRQAAVATSSTRQRTADQSRRDAVVAFENAIFEASDAPHTSDVQKILSDLYKMEAVRKVVDGYKDRASGKEATELKRVRQMAEVAEGDLKVVAGALRKVEGASKGGGAKLA